MKTNDSPTPTKKEYIKPEIVSFTYMQEIGYMGSITPLENLINLYWIDELDKHTSEMETFDQHAVWKADDKTSFWD